LEWFKEEIEKTLFLLEDFLSMNKIKINKELLLLFMKIVLKKEKKKLKKK